MIFIALPWDNYFVREVEESLYLPSPVISGTLSDFYNLVKYKYSEEVFWVINITRVRSTTFTTYL